LPNYDLGKRIEITLQTSTCTRSDIEKWLHFLRECGISKPQAEAKMVVLMDSKEKTKTTSTFFKK
jgi:nitrate reductase NapAB chaperone NapD